LGKIFTQKEGSDNMEEKKIEEGRGVVGRWR
jgi:hypothetical protein